MNTSSHSDAPQHFLFMLPGTTTPAEQEQIVNAARELAATGGYVYVASVHERTMEDREDVRFMPLRGGDLPRFGAVTSVIIAKDRTMVGAAEKAYPQANVIVIEPGDTPQVVRYERRKTLQTGALA